MNLHDTLTAVCYYDSFIVWHNLDPISSEWQADANDLALNDKSQMLYYLEDALSKLNHIRVKQLSVR